MITIVIKEPGKNAYSKEIEDELKEYQKILGGYLEVIYFDDKQVLLCNEEGKLKGLKPNLLFPDGYGNFSEVIVGTIIVVGEADEDFRSLLPEEVDKAIKCLNDYGKRLNDLEIRGEYVNGIGIQHPHNPPLDLFPRNNKIHTIRCSNGFIITSEEDGIIDFVDDIMVGE